MEDAEQIIDDWEEEIAYCPGLTFMQEAETEPENKMAIGGKE